MFFKKGGKGGRPRGFVKEREGGIMTISRTATEANLVDFCRFLKISVKRFCSDDLPTL